MILSAIDLSLSPGMASVAVAIIGAIVALSTLYINQKYNENKARKEKDEIKDKKLNSFQDIINANTTYRDEIRKDLLSAKEEIQKAKIEIEECKKTISELREEVAEYKKTIEILNNTIADLTLEISKHKNLRVDDGGHLYY